MNNFRHQFSLRNTITPELIRHNLPRLATMASQQTLGKGLRSGSISSGLQIHIDHLTIPKVLATLMGQALLVNCPPEIMLLAVDFHEDFIDVEGVAIATVPSLQTTRINGAEFYAEPAP
ncbi:MAG: hypothetical protein ACJAUG_002238 [Halioglobus sp.]|jgi:hypothetical protein